MSGIIRGELLLGCRFGAIVPIFFTMEKYGHLYSSGEVLPLIFARFKLVYPVKLCENLHSAAFGQSYMLLHAHDQFFDRNWCEKFVLV